MPILTTTDLGHSFGARDLFADVNLSLEQGERVALVGPNGAGKSTLLAILAGLLEPTAGVVERADGLTVGYLRQEAMLALSDSLTTVFDEMLAVFADLRAAEQELRALEVALADSAGNEMLAEYGRLQEQFEIAGGYAYELQIRQILSGLGFEPHQWQMPLSQLSGGQQTRLMLARLLLTKPDLLILDEPTNHLDLDAVQWLETTLHKWSGSLVLISHDRAFLDRVANCVWEMVPGGRDEPSRVTAYKGGYSDYVRQRDEAWERAQKLYEEEFARLESEAAFIRQHLAGGQADLARGRLRQLTRDLALIDEVGIVAMAEIRRGSQGWLEVGRRARMLTINEASEQIKRIRPPSGRPPRLSLNLAAGGRSGRTVLKIDDGLVGYPDRSLFRVGDLVLERGQRAALLGPNGSGKTTFINTILSKQPLLEGEVQVGEDVVFGYFAQAHDHLDPQRRVVDEALARSEGLTMTAARHHLAHFLFRGEDVFKTVAELSGGERARLALGLLALGGANVLVLDEPTNHLDLPSQEVLQDALEFFNGTIILTSHDRYLVERLATQIWRIEDGQLVASPTALVTAAQEDDEDGGPVSVAAVKPEIAASRMAWDRRARRLAARRLLELEDALADAEDWLVRLDESLMEAKESGDVAAAAGLEREITTAQQEIDDLLLALEDIASV